MEDLSRCTSWGKQQLFSVFVSPVLFFPSMQQGFTKNKQVFTGERVKAAVPVGRCQC